MTLHILLQVLSTYLWRMRLVSPSTELETERISVDSQTELTQHVPSKQHESFRNTKWRWLTCFLACALLVGPYFVYDLPNILSTLVKASITHDSEKNDIRYNQLYAVYSYPNVILPLVSGILIDKIGLKFAMLLFGSLQLFGHGLFTVAGFMGTEDVTNDWPFIVALAGRLFLGLGGESLAVCQSTAMARWFIGKELSFSAGLSMSTNSLSIVASTYVMPPLANATSIGTAFGVGFII